MNHLLKLIVALAVVCSAALTGVASAQLWSGVLSSSRAIDWSGAGVVGGIPTTWSRCTTGTGTSILASSSTAAQINAAISGCDANHYVELGAGTFNLNNGLLWNAKNNVALRGQGASSTLLVFTGSQSCSGSPTASICFMSTDGNYFGSPSNTANWTAGYSAGSTTITLSSTTNLAVGNPITLDQTDDVCGTITGGVCAGDNSALFICYTPLGQCSSNGDNGGGPRTGRSQQQIVTVTGIAGNVVTISPGLRMPNWSSGKSPQAWWATSPVKNVGIENVSIDSTGAGSNEAITFFNCLNCWVKGVRSVGPTGRSHVVAWQSAHITVQDSYFYKTSDTASVNYGIESLPASDMLVQNNIFEQIQAPYPANGSCTGCVFAYNFDVNNVFCCTTQFQNQSGFAHAVGDDFMLYEGNIGSGFASDNFHGTHHLITNFRNYWNGYQLNEGALTTQATTPLIIKSYSRFYNAIGNVLGNPAKHTTYSTLYDIGFGNGIPNDAQTGITLMRWGNFANCSGASPCQTNVFNNAEVPSGLSGAQLAFANSIPATQTLPASFYLSAQPAWWPSGKTWPPIGPDVTSGNVAYCTGGSKSGSYVLTAGQCPGGSIAVLAGGRIVSNPAMDCYLNSMSGSPDGIGAVLTFNPTLCYSAGALAPDDTLVGPNPGWSFCALPGCDPGGTGVPVSPLQTINNASPSLDGASMQFGMTSAAGGNTNALWVYKYAANDAANIFATDFWVYPAANCAVVQQFEYDTWMSSVTDNIEYMFGMQYNRTSGKWEIWNQLSPQWIPTAATSPLICASWNHIQQTFHRVVGDTNKCSGKPCMYFDTLTVNGVRNDLYLAKPAGTKPASWGSNIGVQWQFNIPGANTTSTENLDSVIFSATTGTPTQTIYRPTVVTDSGTAPTSNAALAYDGDPATFASGVSTNTTAYTVVYRGFPALVGPLANAVVYVVSDAYSAGAGLGGTQAEYSLNGGSTWNQIWVGPSYGSQNTPKTDRISLPVGQDFTQVQVRFGQLSSCSPPGCTITGQEYEVWIQTTESKSQIQGTVQGTIQ